MEETYIPNRFGRFLLMALEQALGTPGFQAMLGRGGLRHLAVYPPDNLERGFPVGLIPRLMAALEEMYGVGKGRELAFQAGQTCFHLGVADFGVLADIADLVFPLLPPLTRARIGLETMAEILNRVTDGHVHVQRQDGHLFWVVERCGVCQGRTSSSPCCHLLAGLLYEAVHWATGRDSVTVTEVACAASGGPHCAMEIDLG
ncbi:MAG: 4-vinyl reductase [Thermoflexales bacterium]|nr:4-vinyl reductase [Thermoflexales bacterium]